MLSFPLDINSEFLRNNLDCINSLITFDKSYVKHKLKVCGIVVSYFVEAYEDSFLNGFRGNYSGDELDNALEHVCQWSDCCVRCFVDLEYDRFKVDNSGDNELIEFVGELERCSNISRYVYKDYKYTKPYIKKYIWKANCSDGGFEDESSKKFDTMEECYNDMRRSALDKMTWNTEWCDFDVMGCDDDKYIGYEVRFNRDKIIHKSYSGVYTYWIEVI